MSISFVFQRHDERQDEAAVSVLERGAEPAAVTRPCRLTRDERPETSPRLRAPLFGTAYGFILASIIWSLIPCACSP